MTPLEIIDRLQHLCSCSGSEALEQVTCINCQAVALIERLQRQRDTLERAYLGLKMPDPYSAEPLVMPNPRQPLTLNDLNNG